MYALQKGAEHYKADGTSNYDDPLFAESVKFFYGLGNEEKIQPDITTYKAGVYPWNAFHSTGKADANGKYDKAQFGMFVCGGWAASMLPNTEKYPRDWKCAILPFPYPEGEQPSISGLPYSFVNNRVLHRAILWAAHDEESLHRWFSSNYNVEVHAYVKNGKYCVVNNTYEPQDTTVYTGDGSSFALHLDANEIKWYNMEG